MLVHRFTEYLEILNPADLPSAVHTLNRNNTLTNFDQFTFLYYV